MNPNFLTTPPPRLDHRSEDRLQAERCQQALRTLRSCLPCDALALLRQEGEQLVTVAVVQLSAVDLPDAEVAGMRYSPGGGQLPDCGLREAVDNYQRQLIATLMHRHQGNLSATARALKVDRGNLHRLVRRLGLSGHARPDRQGKIPG